MGAAPAREGTAGGIRPTSYGENNAIGALSDALMWAPEGRGAMVGLADPTRADHNHFIIVVGQR